MQLLFKILLLFRDGFVLIGGIGKTISWFHGGDQQQSLPPFSP